MSLTLTHELLVIDADLRSALSSANMVRITNNFINDMLAALKMTKLNELQISPAADLRAPGWSFIQPITTSHISGHYFEKPGVHPHIHLDIYSCCAFPIRNVIDVLSVHFNIADWQATFLIRDMDVKKRKALNLSGTGQIITSIYRMTSEKINNKYFADHLMSATPNKSRP